MTVTITLPDHLSERLAQEAQARQMPVDALAADLLTDALESVDLIVARIQALGPVTPSLYPGSTERTREIANIPDEPLLDLDKWNRQWAAVETIMREADKMDELRDLHQVASQRNA